MRSSSFYCVGLLLFFVFSLTPGLIPLVEEGGDGYEETLFYSHKLSKCRIEISEGRRYSAVRRECIFVQNKYRLLILLFFFLQLRV